MEEEYWQLDLGTVNERIAELFKRECFTDVSFSIGEGPKIFNAHKAVLSAASPVFAKMFYGSLAEKTDRAIKLCDIQADVFSKLLNFIYTDKICLVSCEGAFKLYNAAKKYMLKQLEKKCIEYLEKNLKATNALKVYKFAKFFEEKDLEAKVLKLIKEETILVIDSDDFDEIEISTLKTILEQNELQTTEMELFQAVKSLGLSRGVIEENCDQNIGNSVNSNEEEKNQLKKQFREAVKKIQFYSMTIEEFTNGAAFSKLLLPEEALAISVCIQRPSKMEALYPKDFVQNVRPPKNLPHVFFDLSVDGESIGRIVIQLRSDVVPKSVEKFLPYCNGKITPGFKGSEFFNISRSSCRIQAKTSSVIQLAESRKIKKENFFLRNKSPGSVGLLTISGNDNHNEISCDGFFVTFRNYNPSNVLIGHIVQGMDVLAAIESYGTDDGKPSKNVIVANCGELSDKAIF